LTDSALQIVDKYLKRAAEGVGPYIKRRNGNDRRAGYARPSARLRKTLFVNGLNRAEPAFDGFRSLLLDLL